MYFYQDNPPSRRIFPRVIYSYYPLKIYELLPLILFKDFRTIGGTVRKGPEEYDCCRDGGMRMYTQLVGQGSEGDHIEMKICF
jgi:hypothetical protein